MIRISKLCFIYLVKGASINLNEIPIDNIMVPKSCSDGACEPNDYGSNLTSVDNILNKLLRPNETQIQTKDNHLFDELLNMNTDSYSSNLANSSCNSNGFVSYLKNKQSNPSNLVVNDGCSGAYDKIIMNVLSSNKPSTQFQNNQIYQNEVVPQTSISYTPQYQMQQQVVNVKPVQQQVKPKYVIRQEKPVYKQVVQQVLQPQYQEPVQLPQLMEPEMIPQVDQGCDVTQPESQCQPEPVPTQTKYITVKQKPVQRQYIQIPVPKPQVQHKVLIRRPIVQVQQQVKPVVQYQQQPNELVQVQAQPVPVNEPCAQPILSDKILPVQQQTTAQYKVLACDNNTPTMKFDGCSSNSNPKTNCRFSSKRSSKRRSHRSRRKKHMEKKVIERVPVDFSCHCFKTQDGLEDCQCDENN